MKSAINERPQSQRHVRMTIQGFKGIEPVLEACRQGRRESWDRFVRRYRPQILRLANSYCKDTNDAEDVASHAIHSIYKGVGSLRDTACLIPWIHRIVRNSAIDVLVRRRWKACLSLDEMNEDCEATLQDLLLDPGDSPEELAMKNCTRSELLQAVGCLPAGGSELIRLYYFDGCSYQEIARRTRKPVGTIKSGLYRARAGLKLLIPGTSVDH